MGDRAESWDSVRQVIIEAIQVLIDEVEIG